MPPPVAVQPRRVRTRAIVCSGFARSSGGGVSAVSGHGAGRRERVGTGRSSVGEAPREPEPRRRESRVVSVCKNENVGCTVL
jgi:hypothetical protein